MGRYDSPYFNSERYYDPTAGAVLEKLAREERRKFSSAYAISVKFRRDYLLHEEQPDQIKMFSYRYAKQYEAEHGKRKSGKPKALGNPIKNENYIRAYLYCMDNAEVDLPNGGLEKAVKEMFDIEGRRIKQCFTRTGDLGKLVNAWITFTEVKVKEEHQ